MMKINKKELEKLKTLIEKNNSCLVLFGEAHGLLNETKVQEEILKVFSCNVFMYELLEDKKLSTKKQQEKFLLKPKGDDFSIISKNKDLYKTIKLAKKLNLPLIGCDLKNMGRKDNLFRENENKLMRKRELVQFKKINKELEKGKKVFASVGIYHILPRSELVKNLKDKNVVLVYPIFKNGEQFGYKQDFYLKDVEYKVESIKDYLKRKK